MAPGNLLAIYSSSQYQRPEQAHDAIDPIEQQVKQERVLFSAGRMYQRSKAFAEARAAQEAGQSIALSDDLVSLTPREEPEQPSMLPKSPASQAVNDLLRNLPKADNASVELLLASDKPGSSSSFLPSRSSGNDSTPGVPTQLGTSILGKTKPFQEKNTIGAPRLRLVWLHHQVREVDLAAKEPDNGNTVTRRLTSQVKLIRQRTRIHMQRTVLLNLTILCGVEQLLPVQEWLRVTFTMSYMLQRKRMSL